MFFKRFKPKKVKMTKGGLEAADKNEHLNEYWNQSAPQPKKSYRSYGHYLEHNEGQVYTYNRGKRIPRVKGEP